MWVVLVGIAVFAVVSAVGTWRRAKRQQSIQAIAARAGLQYAREDPFGCTRVGFALFRKGDGRGADNVVWRDAEDGHTYRAFDYWYYTESTDSHGSASRTYRRFDCVLVPIDADCPRLSIRRESFLTSLADTLSFHDLQFESEEFSRAFNVRCEVPKFANDLVDARMMAWLLSAGSDIAYEAVGRRVLVAGPRIQPVELTGLLAVACGFVQHVPSVVSSLYPG